MMAIVRTMSSNSQDDILADFKTISLKIAYKTDTDWLNGDLSTVVGDIGEAVNNTENTSDIQAVGRAHDLFAGRFNSMTNSKLETLFDRYKEVLGTDKAAEAAYNLSDALPDVQ